MDNHQDLAALGDWLAPFGGSGRAWHESPPSPYTYQPSDFSKLVAAVHEYECEVQLLRIDCAHYSVVFDQDDGGFYTAECACGWVCPPCPDTETLMDGMMQHAYEAGVLTERKARGV